MAACVVDILYIFEEEKSNLRHFDDSPFVLQDQYDQLHVHTQKGIDFLEKYQHFVDARTKIEQEYASKLRWAHLLREA